MKRIVSYVSVGVAAVMAVTYLIDWIAVAFPGNRKLYEDVRVDQVYTDTNKWNQVEYSRGNPVTERCVNALFPHSGCKPCWYLKKHTMNVTNTD